MVLNKPVITMLTAAACGGAAACEVLLTCVPMLLQPYHVMLTVAACIVTRISHTASVQQLVP